MLGLDELFICREHCGQFVARTFIDARIDAERTDPTFAGIELKTLAGNALANQFFASIGFRKK
ncbi:hypothetical protein DCM91_15835 [Chitinophaga costaii]|uniref:hypothetical protein n=1 Tax=Chitinophaga costaii TaxID=1335309 RepID=UPI000B7F93AF|nr:hypothetical protein [Chitinophaga costaii]PUZ21506.1 hypothetical protein DCM91_15835 [Chitinophaga costaii]